MNIIEAIQPLFDALAIFIENDPSFIDKYPTFIMKAIHEVILIDCVDCGEFWETLDCVCQMCTWFEKRDDYYRCEWFVRIIEPNRKICIQSEKV